MKKSVFITLSVIFAVVGTVVGSVLYFNKNNEAQEYKSRLEYVYQQNFYELVDNVNNIESNLSKLSVSTDKNMQNQYLSKISTLSNNAQDNISVLPIEHNAINETITYLNQLGGYTSTLQQDIVLNQKLDMDEMSQIDDLLTTSKTVKQELNKLSVLISDSNYSIIDNLASKNNDSSKFNNEWANFNNGMIEYPQLIYDGPFSDSVVHKEIKGLSQNEISQTQATLNMQKWFENCNIEENGKTTGGDFDTYNFVLTNNNDQYYAQVSVRDGVLLELNSGEESTQNNHTEDECCLVAQDFAKKLGFMDMQPVWSTLSNNFCYVNIAPVVDNVIIYPDEIKVKVSAETGQIVGWEAKSWAYNHTQRNDLVAVVSKQDATKSVSSNMDIRTTKLVVTPNEFSGETLCWEFMCVYEGSTYYVYINAKTGVQANILKVVETDDGNLLM